MTLAAVLELIHRWQWALIVRDSERRYLHGRCLLFQTPRKAPE